MLEDKKALWMCQGPLTRVNWKICKEECQLPTTGALLGLLVTVRAAVAPAAPVAPALHVYWSV